MTEQDFVAHYTEKGAFIQEFKMLKATPKDRLLCAHCTQSFASPKDRVIWRSYFDTRTMPHPELLTLHVHCDKELLLYSRAYSSWVRYNFLSSW